MPTPTFIVIGCRKCATTNLCRLLETHPDVFMTNPKEPQYFSRLTTFDRDRDWYASLFAGTESYIARGEGSTTYTFPRRIELAAPRIHRAIPDCRLIYMVRHPIQRIESDWKSRVRDGQTLPSINEAVEADHNLVTLGLYWKHLEVYRQFFPDDQILVVFFDEFAREPIAVLRRVFAHIGVNPDFEPPELISPRTPATVSNVDTPLGARVRSVPGSAVLKRLLPRSVVGAAKGILTKEQPVVAQWDPEILRAIRDLYRPDTEMLLKHCGKPQDYWNLDN